MTEYRDPQTEHIDSIRDWLEFLEVMDAWENVTSTYWDADDSPDLFSVSGRYSWWATLLAKWIVENSKLSPEPMLAITRMIQAKDPIGDMREFAATPEDIHRKRYEWRPYRQLLIEQAEAALANGGDSVNDERDRWFHEQWQHERKTWDAILAEFKRVRASKGWRIVSSINGIRTAAKNYAAAHSLPFRGGKAGRPKQAK